MKQFLLPLFILFLLLFTGCVQKPYSKHNAKTSLDYLGVYVGTLPCSNCEGIKTSIRLMEDRRYQKQLIYLGQHINNYEASGRFRWLADRNRIMLDDGSYYFVSEGYLLALNNKGEKITGDFSPKYRLEKFNISHIIDFEK